MQKLFSSEKLVRSTLPHFQREADFAFNFSLEPLPSSTAKAILAESRSLAYTPKEPTPASSVSLADELLPSLKSDRQLLALARLGEIGAGISLERISAKYHGFGKGFAGTDGAPVGGYSGLIESLGRKIVQDGAEIAFDQEVISITELGSEQGVEVKTRSGKTFVGKTCISTIPLGVLKHSPPTFSPPLDPAFNAAVERTAVGVLEKVRKSHFRFPIIATLLISICAS